MRLILLLAVTLSATAYAGEVRTRKLPPPPAPGPIEKTLSASDVMKFFDADYLPEVRDCWMQHVARKKAATGRFTIGLIITPVGEVLRFTLSAPGMRNPFFEECVAAASEGWHFPDRGGYTAVEIPVTLVKTRAPGAGPMKK